MVIGIGFGFGSVFASGFGFCCNRLSSPLERGKTLESREKERWSSRDGEQKFRLFNSFARVTLISSIHTVTER